MKLLTKFIIGLFNSVKDLSLAIIGIVVMLVLYAIFGIAVELYIQLAFYLFIIVTIVWIVRGVYNFIKTNLVKDESA